MQCLIPTFHSRHSPSFLIGRRIENNSMKRGGEKGGHFLFFPRLRVQMLGVIYLAAAEVIIVNICNAAPKKNHHPGILLQPDFLFLSSFAGWGDYFPGTQSRKKNNGIGSQR
ncbi:UNVERIFIED_CONTAM: hypothetical protein NCL1_27756 [Trichonephila clavipes]